MAWWQNFLPVVSQQERPQYAEGHYVAEIMEIDDGQMVWDQNEGYIGADDGVEGGEEDFDLVMNPEWAARFAETEKRRALSKSLSMIFFDSSIIFF